MARARTTLIVQFVLLASIAVAGQTIAPAAVQTFPTEVIWAITVSARPLAPPVSSADRLFLALQSGVSARRLSDGSEIWQAPLEADGPLAVSDERVAVSAKSELHVLDAATGAVLWSDRTGPLTAPPLVYRDWLFAASAEHITCYLLADGSKVWTRETGVVNQRPAVEGARVYVAAADGRLLALNLASGEPAWEYDAGIEPTEPMFQDGRVFIGSAAKRFCSIKSDTGQKDWCTDIGAKVIGRPVADASHVYLVAFDNLLRAYDRKNGAYRWKRDLRYRPSAGPMLVGASVAAPGSVPRVQVFDVLKGTPTILLTLRAALTTVPLLIEPVAGAPARIVGLSGGLPRVWTVTLAGPAPPMTTVAPLTTLPGLVIPVAAPPAPPERQPPDAAPLPRSDRASAPRTTA